MNTAEKVYERVKGLPEPVLKEILDFIEFMSQKAEGKSKNAQEKAASSSEWSDIVLKFEGDPNFPAFELYRDQLVAPAEDPLS